MNAFFRKLGWLFTRRVKEAELQEEIQFHLAQEAEEQEASGVPSAEAQIAARRELVNIARMQEDTRDAWGWTLLEQLLQDLRYGGRTMGSNKTFTVLAIVSLALGIGANTAIFSFMDSILLRSLPVSDPKSLVLLEWHTEKRTMHGTNRHDDSYTDPNGGFVVGLYATMSYNVIRRTREIGIRMALGAQRTQIVRMVLREVAVLVAAAMIIGVPAALFATKVIESFLFGLKRNDPLTLSIAVLTLIVAAVLASYLPARGASRIDPMRALRHE